MNLSEVDQGMAYIAQVRDEFRDRGDVRSKGHHHTESFNSNKVPSTEDTNVDTENGYTSNEDIKVDDDRTKNESYCDRLNSDDEDQYDVENDDYENDDNDGIKLGTNTSSTVETIRSMAEEIKFQKESLGAATAIGQEFMCGCCTNIIIKATSLIPCGHTFCLSCISEWSLTCPTCRLCFRATIPSHTVNNAIQACIALQEQQQRHTLSLTTSTTSLSTLDETMINTRAYPSHNDTGTKSTANSATSFFSLDDINSYRTRVQDSGTEQTFDAT